MKLFNHFSMSHNLECTFHFLLLSSLTRPLVSKDIILYDSIHMTFSKGKAIETVDRSVTAKEGRGCDYKGTQRAVGDDELFCFLRVVVVT